MKPPLRKADIFLIVPAYNEGRVIARTLRPLIAAGYSIVVVDDCSRDGTWRRLAGLPLYRLRHPFNLGQGAALQTGMQFALQQGARYLVHFDADGQHSPEDLPGLLQPVVSGQADVVLGSRFLREEDWRAVPPARRLLLKAAIWVNWLLTGVRLSDAHNGARVFSRAAARQINLRENGFAHATEILAQIKAARLKVVERPTRIRYTDYSKLKGQRAWHAVDIFVDLVIRRLMR